MHRLRYLAAIAFALSAGSLVAAPADATRIQKSYQLAMDKWALEMRIANTPADRAKAWAARPDATPFAREMWGTIGGSLAQDWTLEPAAWFLKTTPGILATQADGSVSAVFAKQNEAIRQTIETTHVKSPKLGPVCAALTVTSDPRSLSTLEKIQATNPDPKIAGTAALGAAMQLKALGDDAEVIRRRLTYLRKAIIQASDVPINDTTVAKLAQDELYIITYLTKGRTAPDLVGMDCAKRAMALSAHKGKVIVLIFWNSNVPDAQRLVEISSALDAKYKGKGLIVIGVNNDTTEKLRALQADGTVPFANFSDPDNKLAAEYRVGTWPLVYVLDGERKIHYSGAPGSFAQLTAEDLLTPKK